MKILSPQSLTAESFAVFGDVIEANDLVKHFTINGGNTERYHDLANIDVGEDGKVIVSIFRGQERQLPFTIEMMERHPKGCQTFIPMSGHPYLVVVAPANEVPKADNLSLFIARPNQGVNYAKGVWHHPLLALGGVSDFLVIDRSGPGNNCDEIQLEEHHIIQPLC